jgi:short-subunit dehydrogenase
MSKTAVITGASTGIGRRFAQLLAGKGYDLVLVARDENRLKETAVELEKEFGITCEILAADLSTVNGSKSVEERVSDQEKPINVLINNAGFGMKESFLESQIDSEQKLLDVLVRTPMRLMHAVLPQMKASNSGIIINVSSVAGWIAGGTYSAAKSYLTVLSESLHTELRFTKVNVLALCPGFTHTEFHQQAKMRMGSLPKFMWLEADHVVEQAWSDALAGKAISVPGWQYKILSSISRFAPRPLVRKVGMNVRARQRRK